MNILYLSCHSILEFDEISLFSELEHQIISQGSYRNPSKPAETSRPPIPGAYYNEKLANSAPSVWGEKISEELIEWADIIYIPGIESWLPTNWESMEHKNVVFRSIGQCVEHTENVLSRYKKKGLKIVRYSPLERNIPGYVGSDAMIRFYKDPDEWKGWNGNIVRVITCAQAMKKRDAACKFHLFEKVTRGFNRKLYGHSNEDVNGALSGGALSYEEYLQVLRDNRVFFYTGTYPAQYTLAFIEALMTGIPVVCIGKNLAGFEVETSNFIKNGENGFVVDSLLILRQHVQALLEDQDLAREIGNNGRKTAIELFGKDKIKEQWKVFFEEIEKI